MVVNHQFQSTHPRRVRLQLRHAYRITESFNPRTHVGCDLASEKQVEEMQSFNPRTHVGCDSCGHGAVVHSQSFNPRTHVGCDAYIV